MTNIITRRRRSRSGMVGTYVGIEHEGATTKGRGYTFRLKHEEGYLTYLTVVDDFLNP